MTELESGFRIGEVVDLLRRRFPIMVVAGLVGLVAGFLVFASAPPNFNATARVQVNRLPDQLSQGSGSGGGGDQVDLATERDLVKSDAVGDAVRAQLGLDGDNRSLFKGVSIASQEDSRVLEITASSTKATKARDVANAVAAAYLAERKKSADATLATTTARLNDQITDANAAVSDAAQEVQATEPNTTERAAANAALQSAQSKLSNLNSALTDLAGIDTSSVGAMVRKAPLPATVLSKMAVGKGVGVFGLCLFAGLALALLVDRRDSLGGGRRAVAQLVPSANIRILPTATGRAPSPAEIDAAIDRLAVELAGQGGRGRANSVLVVGTEIEPPLALAEELAASLTFAGIPALFVIAGSSEREVSGVVRIASFTDLITGPSVTGPGRLPERAGEPGSTSPAAPAVAWLQPRGSTESSGLLRRAVVEALVTRAAREGFEAVVFVAGTPTRNAAAAALGPWVTKTTVVVDHTNGNGVVDAVRSLQEAGVAIAEVVWS